MERSDRLGFGAAIAGHLLLFAALSLTIAHRKPPVKPLADTMDVQLVDAVGLQSAAPTPATEAPQQAEAPEIGPVVEEAPAPSQPAPIPAPAQPRPTPPPPAPVPLPTPKPAPPKPTPPAKPAPVPAKPTPAKPAAKPGLSSDLLKDIRSAARGERATGQKLGPDFLKGVVGNAAKGKGTNARAAMTGPALNGLAAAIKRQVQPCFELGGLGGTPAMQIVTVLQLRFNEDGSVAGTPQLVEQQGVNEANRRYAAQMVDVSRRAVLKCAPLKLPPELYAGGWENITMGFIPGQMR